MEIASTPSTSRLRDESLVFATVWRPGEGTFCELDLNDDKPDGDMSKVLRALSVHGYVILKRATEVEAFWDGKVQDLSDHEVKSKMHALSSFPD